MDERKKQTCSILDPIKGFDNVKFHGVIHEGHAGGLTVVLSVNSQLVYLPYRGYPLRFLGKTIQSVYYDFQKSTLSFEVI